MVQDHFLDNTQGGIFMLLGSFGFVHLCERSTKDSSISMIGMPLSFYQSI